MARCNTINWSDDIPFVLLGIRTSVKEGLNCSPAEMVYGQTLTVPGDFFVQDDTTISSDPNSFADIIKQRMRNVKSYDTRQSDHPAFIPKSLDTSDYVFVRVDRLRTGLRPPYDGPFKVVRRLRKYFVVDVGGKHTSISVDRLKPAYGILSESSSQNKPDSVRRVTFQK